MSRRDVVIVASVSAIYGLCGPEEYARQCLIVNVGEEREQRSILSRMVEKISGVEIISAAASSKLALTWLSEGKAHIAGSHLEDPKTGEFNLPFIRKQFPPLANGWVFFENAGGGRLPIINISGGTEIIGCFLQPMPIQALKPCSLGGPAPGMSTEVVDGEGRPVRGGTGTLVCTRPAPSRRLCAA